MPKALERKLAKEAKSKGLSKERTGAYVYGTMSKLGLMNDKNANKSHDKKMARMHKALGSKG